MPLAGPRDSADPVLFRQLGVEPSDGRVQAQQARLGPQDGLTAAAPGRLEPEVLAGLLEGRLWISTAVVQADHLRRREDFGGGVEELVAVRPGAVADVDPPDGREAPAGLAS